MNRRRWWIVGAGLLAALLLARCVRSCGGDTDDAEVLTATAVRGPLVVSVRGAGEIMAKESNKLIPQIKRPAELEFLVPEGQRVAKGEVVARFTTDEIERQVSDADAAVDTMEQNLLSAQTDLEIQRMESATSLKLAEQALRAAQSELEKLIEGDEPMERRAAELKVTTTSSKYERNKKRHKEIQGLLAEGFVTEDQVEEERIGEETAQVEYETAQVELRTLKQYTLPLKRQNAENAVAKAGTELEKTRKTNEVQLRKREQAADAAARAVEKAKSDLAKLQEDLTNYTVRASTDGVVTYGDPENPWRRSEIVVGSTISPGQVLMTVPDMSAMQAVINVPEADVSKVRKEQPVTVHVEAVPGRAFKGVVRRVAEVANAGGWLGTAVKEFKVEVSLEDGADLKPGFSCDAEIVTDVVPEAVQVPVQAIFREGDEMVAYLQGLTRQTRKAVKIGRSSMTHVEVTEGLSEGDRVLLSQPMADEDREGS